MLFTHTIEHVLAKTKTQTSRIWKDNYVPEYYDGHLLSIRNPRGNLLYYVGQELSVQPNRGMKGIARIRIQELHKADVRDFDADDFKREMLNDKLFYETWASMHDKWLWKKAQRETFDFYNALRGRHEERYTALVFIFELVTEQKAAA